MKVWTGILALLAVGAQADVSAHRLLPREFRIAVVKAGGSPQQCADRMKRVAPQADVTLIEPGSDLKELRRFSLVVLPSEWTNDWKTISDRREAYAQFVRSGGGLLLFQPNPFGFKNESLCVDLLPATFTVQNRYSDSSVKIVSDHVLVRGLGVKDMPYPCDRITECDREWTVLARGEQSGDASLLVARFGSGRAAVDADHPNRDSDTTGFHSDAFLRRLVLWLSNR